MTFPMVRRFTLRGVSLLLALLPGPAGAIEQVWRLDAANSTVRFDLPATAHDVHGAIALKGGEVHFDPATGQASGWIGLDASSAVSGNGSRDRTMRQEVLEVGRFPEIRFDVDSMRGAVPESGAADVEFDGRITLRGDEHPLTLRAHLVAEGRRVRADLEFPVPFVAWGLKDPSLFVLRVSPVVTVKVVAVGDLSASGR
jgi:polyisoprenoid-binding protein YceI